MSEESAYDPCNAHPTMFRREQTPVFFAFPLRFLDSKRKNKGKLGEKSRKKCAPIWLKIRFLNLETFLILRFSKKKIDPPRPRSVSIMALVGVIGAPFFAKTLQDGVMHVGYRMYETTQSPDMLQSTIM